VVDAERCTEVLGEAFQTRKQEVIAMIDKQSREKKAYEAPNATVINLRPEEAVLGNCKSLNHGGPGGNPCCTSGNCMCSGS
jgi:hypothetical protein